MGGALSIFVLLSLSVFIVRVASVALRLTGLTETSARFQALSAFTGTGFTTSEAESVVNYPVRRRIVSVLMIIGNLGLVTVFATLVASLVNTEGEIGAVVRQLAWLLGGLLLLWFLMLNSGADRVMCRLIGRVLMATTFLGRRRFQRLLQIGAGYSVCEHPIGDGAFGAGGSIKQSDLGRLGLTVIAVRTASGELSTKFSSSDELDTGDVLILYGSDAGHEALRCDSCRSDTDARPQGYRNG